MFCNTLNGLVMISRGISLKEVMVVTTQRMKMNNTMVKTNLTCPPKNVPGYKVAVLLIKDCKCLKKSLNAYFSLLYINSYLNNSFMCQFSTITINLKGGALISHSIINFYITKKIKNVIIWHSPSAPQSMPPMAYPRDPPSPAMMVNVARPIA